MKDLNGKRVAISKLKKYDLILFNNTVCCYIGKHSKYSNTIHAMETIYDIVMDTSYEGVPLDGHFPSYKPVFHSYYWGYGNILNEGAILLEHRNGKKPTYEYIRRKYKDFKV